MAPAAAFSEVLDAFVMGSETGGIAAAGRWHPGIATRSLFWFEGAAGVSHRRPAMAIADASSVEPRTDAPRFHVIRPARTTARVLSPRQHLALAQLIDLGANLDADFSLDQLRSTYRSLARRYHPDRHATLPDSEKKRLSSTFATLRGAYEQLKNAA
jgi:hypothetical protein